jgi:REP element-mobilizing transposase RayT
MSEVIRERNRLKGYDYSLTGAYFITICTQDNKEILSAISESLPNEKPSITLTDVGKLVYDTIMFYDNKKNVKIGNLCIMPNHVHFILHYLIEPGVLHQTNKTKNLSLSDFIRMIKTWITKQIGSSIFQRSFYDHIIRDEMDYQRVVKYKETNPSRWIGDYNFRANPMIGLSPLFKCDVNRDD